MWACARCFVSFQREWQGGGRTGAVNCLVGLVVCLVAVVVAVVGCFVHQRFSCGLNVNGDIWQCHQCILSSERKPTAKKINRNTCIENEPTASFKLTRTWTLKYREKEKNRPTVLLVAEQSFWMTEDIGGVVPGWIARAYTLEHPSLTLHCVMAQILSFFLGSKDILLVNLISLSEINSCRVIKLDVGYAKHNVNSSASFDLRTLQWTQQTFLFWNYHME